MIIKHDRHIFLEIHKVCKGLWAFVFLVVLFGCCLAGQTNSVSLELERAHPHLPFASAQLFSAVIFFEVLNMMLLCCYFRHVLILGICNRAL